jgi:hypothetical protein
MKAEGKDCCCCKDMAGKDHAGHDMHAADGSKPQADQHKH